MTAPMTAAAANWIYTEVLTATYRAANSIDGKPVLIRNCRCSGGRCGHCMAGRHEQCYTRAHGPHIGCETWICTQTGGARTAVWLSGRPCRWVCACTCPEPEPEKAPALFDAGPARVKRHGQPETKRHRELFGQLDLFDLAGGGR